MKFHSALLALALLAAVPAAGQDAWKLDRAHSSIEFAVTHMVIAEATGRFKDFDVVMTTTGDDLTASTLEATIQTASVMTDNDYRDNDLRGPEFFDTEKYPTAVFKSTKWEKAGENKFKVTGDLTIRDKKKPVVLDVTYFGSITDAHGGTRAGWKAETTIDRFEFGTIWNKTLETGGLVVSKDVRLTMRVELKKGGGEQKPPSPPPDKK
jgi:polyisoprenoid-binding protein YceI